MASQEERDRIMAAYIASVQNDDDEEEDEGDFHPGMEDDDDDEDEGVLAYDDDQDEDDSSRLRGSLEQTDTQLRYHGEVVSEEGGKFDFRSSTDEKLSWSLLDDPFCKGTESRIVKVKGSLGSNSSVEVSMRFEPVTKNIVANSDSQPPPALKSTGLDDDEDDAKKPAATHGDEKKPAATDSRKAPPPLPPIYSLVGKGPDFAFSGELDLSKIEQTKGNLVAIAVECVLQPPTKASAVAVAAAPSKPVSEADDEAAVGKVGLDELMALQQEAGFSVGSVALGKRSRRRAATNGLHANKKRAPAGEDDDDDDDIGF